MRMARIRAYNSAIGLAFRTMGMILDRDVVRV
jgi:hypothetical protein